MSGKTDVVKGRIKEATGALTGNDELRAEGKLPRVLGLWPAASCQQSS